MQTAGLSQVYICMLLIRNYKQKLFRHYVLMFRSTNEKKIRNLKGKDFTT